MKAKWIMFAIAVIGAAGFALWKNQQNSSSALAGIVAVNGRLELKRLDIATLYPGKVEEVLVNEGDSVSVDQVLARLSSSQSQAQLDAALAQKQRAQESVSRALAEIDARQQQVNIAKLELDNAVKLRKDNLISATELERRQASHKAAVAAVNTAQAAKAEAQAAVAQAEAQLEAAQSQHNDMQISAPKAGWVEYQIAEVGDVVGAGGKIVSILDPSDTYINVFLTSRQTNQIKIGDDARIVIDGVDAVFPARISFVAANAQFTPKSVETNEERAKLMFKVKLQMPQETALQYNKWLRGGMTALGYVKYDPQASWPPHLEVNLPRSE